MREHLRILSEIHDRPWAITARALDSIVAILERPVADLDAVATKLGRPLENTGQRVEQRGSTAILGVEGPIFRYANLFTAISGATSIELLARDFQTALENAAVEQILLNVNSPGGQVDGLNEFADQVHAGTKIKPVVAYIDGLGASAAYWISAAASQIVTNEGSFQGSIGIVATLTDNRAAQERQGVKRYEIVSSQSPRKRADLETDAGRAQIQEMVDAIADLFIGRVASFRGVTVDKVLAEFGQGGMLPAARAKAVGMVDGISSFEALLRALDPAPEPMVVRRAMLVNSLATNTATSLRTRLQLLEKENPMADIPTPAAAPAAPAPPASAPAPAPIPAAAAPTVDPVAEERRRILGILNCPEAVGREALARVLCETGHDVATAQRILAAAAPVPTASPEPPVNALEREMARIPNPKVGTTDPEGDESVAAEAMRVLAFVPKSRQIQRVS